MTDTYNDTTGSRKKFLIPLVVLLLCAVSLTGAGYAYNATVVNTDNPVDVDGVTMKLTNGQGADVTANMYDLSDVDIATHTVNGKAIKYAADPANAVGFVTAEAKADDQNPHYNMDIDDPANYGNDLVNFKNGYYVEMFKDDVAAGYQDPVAKSDINTAAKITAAVAAKQIFKIGNDYLLKVVNASEGAIKIQADLAGTVDIDGVPEIFLVCKLNGEVTGLIALSDDGYGDLATLTNNATETVYTIEAYVALSDYYSASVPAIAGATAFDVLFQTVATA